MRDIINKRCFNHIQREAAAVCPECGRYFCRECITEHDDRIICASCLRKKLKPSFKKHLMFITFARIGQGLFGFLILWMFFYYLGQILVYLPSSFHEGTVWNIEWDDE
jgi:hypothetical protein